MDPYKRTWLCDGRDRGQNACTTSDTVINQSGGGGEQFHSMYLQLNRTESVVSTDLARDASLRVQDGTIRCRRGGGRRLAGASRFWR
jgi:hypothetical protein